MMMSATTSVMRPIANASTGPTMAPSKIHSPRKNSIGSADNDNFGRAASGFQRGDNGPEEPQNDQKRILVNGSIRCLLKIGVLVKQIMNSSYQFKVDNGH